MAREYWFPLTIDGQQNHFLNVKDKISFYEAPLAMDTADVNRIIDICTEVLAAIEYTREAKITLQSLTEWRNSVLEGPEEGLATVPPEFTQMPIMTGLKFNLYDEYKKLVAKEKLKSEFTTAIGEDLGWLGTEKPDQLLEQIIPEFTYTAGSDFSVTIKGKMQGMNGARIDFRPNGSGTWTNVAYISNTPATFTFTPATPGQPESGDFRARYIKKNVSIGEYSMPFTLTVKP
jgi:hypothetical protein